MAERIKLYESRGETSVFIDAEIRDDGDLVLSGQDIGAAPEKFFGDSDYEYVVHVKAEALPALLRVLQDAAAEQAQRGGGPWQPPPEPGLAARIGRFLRPRGPAAAAPALPREAVETEVLALLTRLFGGNARAVSAFLDFTAAHGIAREFGSWS